MKNKLLKDVYFNCDLYNSNKCRDKNAYIPVALYLKSETEDNQRYEIFEVEMEVRTQGLEVIKYYRDLEEDETLPGLHLMLSDLNEGCDWLAIIIASKNDFSFGTMGYDLLCQAAIKVPILTIDFVKKSNNNRL